MDHRNRISQLKSIYYTLETFLDKEDRDWEAVNKYIELFIDKGFDVNYLKTILIHTKGYKDFPIVKENREKILQEYKRRMEEKGLIPI